MQRYRVGIAVLIFAALGSSVCTALSQSGSASSSAPLQTSTSIDRGSRAANSSVKLPGRHSAVPVSSGTGESGGLHGAFASLLDLRQQGGG